jgi:hypothetical protein
MGGFNSVIGNPPYIFVVGPSGIKRDNFYLCSSIAELFWEIGPS